MRYKVGDKVVIVNKLVYGMNQRGFMNKWLGTTMTIDRAYKNLRYTYRMVDDNQEWEWNDDMIDHKATAKLTLPQPSKDMLRSGMKVVLKNGYIRFPLVEVGCFYDECGDFKGNIRTYSNELKCLLLICDNADIMQIWDGDTLIAQRAEKSEAELKKESLEKQIEELSASINISVKQLDKLKKEIKSI